MNTIANNFSAYSPLDSGLKQIRLLLIHAGPQAAPLSCSLVPASLIGESRRDYEALSYCWGDLRDQEVITLDAQVFTITKSGGDALRAVRQEDETRVVWMDAICINQQDTSEREAQVYIMKEIYEVATRTLIFLGKDDGTFDPASGLMLALVRQMMDHIGDSSWEAIGDTLKSFKFASTDMADIRSHGIPQYDDAAWCCLEKWLGRPWFSRIWVLQEVVVSRTSIALCGVQELDWKVVEFAMAWIRRRRYDARSLRPGLSQVSDWDWVTWFGRQCPLQQLLRLTRNFQATDPRDKIFGLLGLATDCQTAIPSEVQPDYHRATASIYSDATKYMIQSSQSLDALSQIGHIIPYNDSTKNSQDSFPSWVPRWDLAAPQSPENDNRAIPFNRNATPYSSSGCSVMPLNDQVGEPDILLLQGLGIDQIKSLSPMIMPSSLVDTDLMTSLWNHYASKLKTYPTGESLLKAFSLTMVADATTHREPTSTNPHHDFDFAACVSARGGTMEGLSVDEQDLLVANALRGDDIRYEQAVGNATQGRSFCTTEAGRMGICPPTAKEGDLICLLFGGSVLYVIRREREHSTFVGECYIHGCMDGSAYDHQMKRHAPAEMFCLH